MPPQLESDSIDPDSTRIVTVVATPPIAERPGSERVETQPKARCWSYPSLHHPRSSHSQLRPPRCQDDELRADI